jgi:hypothetical protein
MADSLKIFKILNKTATTYKTYRMCTFYIENDAEIFPVHYTWKVAEKGFKIAL